MQIYDPITIEDIDEEVRGALDTSDPVTVGWIQRQVTKAERRLLATCPTLERRLRDNPRLQGIARDIVIEAVGRVALTQAEDVGIKSESEDGYSYTIDPLSRSNNIWFPDKDLVLLGCGTASTNFVPRSARLTPGRVWAYPNTGYFGCDCE